MSGVRPRAEPCAWRSETDRESGRGGSGGPFLALLWRSVLFSSTSPSPPASSLSSSMAKLRTSSPSGPPVALAEDDGLAKGDCSRAAAVGLAGTDALSRPNSLSRLLRRRSGRVTPVAVCASSWAPSSAGEAGGLLVGDCGWASSVAAKDGDVLGRNMLNTRLRNGSRTGLGSKSRLRVARSFTARLCALIRSSLGGCALVPSRPSPSAATETFCSAASAESLPLLLCLLDNRAFEGKIHVEMRWHTYGYAIMLRRALTS